MLDCTRWSAEILMKRFYFKEILWAWIDKMAGNDRVIIQNLLERVEELSEMRKILPRSAASINSEVRAVISLGTSFPCLNSNHETLPSRTNASPSSHEQGLASSSENRLPFCRNILFQARLYFPAARPTTIPQNHRKGNRAQRQTADIDHFYGI